MERLSDRIVAPLVALSLVLIIVAGMNWGRAAAVSQENATLEQRVAALEANAIPRSPNLTWNGGYVNIAGVFSNPADEITMICAPGDALAGIRDDPAGQKLIAVGAVGYRCEIAPPRLP